MKYHGNKIVSIKLSVSDLKVLKEATDFFTNALFSQFEEDSNYIENGDKKEMACKRIFASIKRAEDQRKEYALALAIRNQVEALREENEKLRDCNEEYRLANKYT